MMLPPPWLVAPLVRISDVLARLRRRLMPREYAALELGTSSWVALSVAAFCELRLADALEHGPANAAQLSAQGYGDERMLYRLLRSLCAYDVVTCTGDGLFTLDYVGRALCGRDSMAAMIRYANAPWHIDAYAHLAQGVRSAMPAFSLRCGAALFEYLRSNDEAGRMFDEAMQSQTRLFAQAFAQAYDFTGAQSIVDVGGGTGLLLAAVIARAPRIKATVFEIPEVVARAHPLAGVAFVSGDMFAGVPPSADIFVLSHVLHDWDDARCETILRNVRAAMPAHSRLLIYELVASPFGNDWSLDRVSDLEMMTMLPGRERTREEFGQLVSRARLRLERLIATSAPEVVIECVPV